MGFDEEDHSSKEAWDQEYSQQEYALDDNLEHTHTNNKDVFIICGVDGKVHTINAHTGEFIGFFDSGEALIGTTYDYDYGVYNAAGQGYVFDEEDHSSKEAWDQEY